MLNSSSNPVISHGDNEKIGLVENRLSQLQYEVLKATESRDALKKEQIQAEEDTVYARDVLRDINQKIQETRQELVSLQTEIAENKKAINLHNEQIKKDHVHIDGKKSEIEDRHKTVTVWEKELSQRALVLSEKERMNEQDRELLVKAKMAFEQAIEYVKWQT